MKSLTIITIAFALGFGAAIATPATAQAPRLSMEEQIAQQAIANPKQYAKQQLRVFGFDNKQYVCLARLWGKESAWNHKAANPKSSAFGIAQLLGEKSKLPHIQINKGLRYIIHRYDNPCNAWRFWQKNYYY
jgi:hypothetical protein